MSGYTDKILTDELAKAKARAAQYEASRPNFSQWNYQPSNYQQATNQYDPTNFNKLQQNAWDTGESAWATAANKRNQMNVQDMANQATGQVAGQTAGAMSNAAMSGGLGGGAAARLGRAGINAQMGASQNVYGQGAKSSADIQLADLQSKQNLQQQLPTMGLAAAQYGTDVQKANMQAALEEAAKRNQFATDKFKTYGQVWSGEQMANALRYQADNS